MNIVRFPYTQTKSPQSPRKSQAQNDLPRKGTKDARLELSESFTTWFRGFAREWGVGNRGKTPNLLYRRELEAGSLTGNLLSDPGPPNCLPFDRGFPKCKD